MQIHSTQLGCPKNGILISGIANGFGPFDSSFVLTRFSYFLQRSAIAAEMDAPFRETSRIFEHRDLRLKIYSSTCRKFFGELPNANKRQQNDVRSNSRRRVLRSQKRRETVPAEKSRPYRSSQPT
jgi:hypothetical protein